MTIDQELQCGLNNLEWSTSLPVCYCPTRENAAMSLLIASVEAPSTHHQHYLVLTSRRGHQCFVAKTGDTTLLQRGNQDRVRTEVNERTQRKVSRY